MQFNFVISVLFYCAANGRSISSWSPLENCSHKINCPSSMASHIVFISIFYVRCRCEPSFRVLYSCFICGIYIWTWHCLLLFIYFILRILNTALKSKQFWCCGKFGLVSAHFQFGAQNNARFSWLLYLWEIGYEAL